MILGGTEKSKRGAAVSKRAFYTITRDGGGKSIGPYEGLTLRECGQMVAFCATDNLGHTRQEATKLGMAAEKAFKAGQSFDLDVYTFTTTEEGK